MISTEARKFILKLIIVSVCFECANGCDSNKQLYTDIGCKPIYTNDSTTSSCPIAYDCENVFTRSSNKCYFNGNFYEPSSYLSESDSALKDPCLAACFCEQRTYNNKTTTKFVCAHVECPRYFMPLMESCYHQFTKNECCEINTHCPEKKEIIHECTYDGQVYKDGQRFYVSDNYQCVCSPEFNGTVNDKTCKKIDCSYEILHLEKILKLSAPVYFENVNGCPIDWYHPETVNVTSEKTSTVSTTKSHECKFGDLNFSIGQKLNIGLQSDSDTYNTTCSCNTPPLVTCIKVRK